MQKINCLLFLLILFIIKGYAHDMFSDSIGRDELKSPRPSKIILLKRSIVRTAFNEYEIWRADSITREDDPQGVRKVKQYWLSVGKQMQEKDLKDSLWQENHPWSSAFISWVITKSGAADKFKPSPNHAGYIVWARQNQKLRANKNIFVAYDICDPNSKWPEPGDLICKNRDGNNFSLSTITASDISHSDIVVEVDTVAKTIVTIGGNVRNTVSKRIIHLDSEGYIDTASTWRVIDDEMGYPEGSQSEFFAVIKLRKPE